MGQLKDWEQLKASIEKLNEYELKWWTDGIIWILDKIIATYDDKLQDEERKVFWKHIFKYYYGGGSGVNPSIDGWIVNFIPYINNKPSPFAKRSFEKLQEEYKSKDQDVSSDDEDDDWFTEVDLT